MFSKKTLTTDQAIALATQSLANDIVGLSEQKEDAISVFRATANQLAAINSTLQIKVGNLNDIAKFIDEQSALANQMIGDNDKVRSKILDIIGE